MKIAALQLNSKLDPRENLEVIENLLSEANAQNIEAVFLPEVFYSMSDAKSPTPYLVQKGNEHYLAIQNLAKKYQVYLLGGTAATKNENGKIVNRAYNFAPTGEDLGHYDKIHLFSCDLSRHESKKIINEADVYTAGIDPKIIEAHKMKIGLSICFDLRFPEMYRDYLKSGVNTLCIPAAFTVPTGKAHWHTLLRARAIENQCFVIAAAQWGVHNPVIQTYGHSLIIDPWGEILADAQEGVKMITANLDWNRQKEIKSRLNIAPN